ncbi:deleted in malignant brain tumors 1 protein-like [Phalacrocorax carbo]|uniref:deleted in malignant brain tumors 1 protein-like n=1 Tax=Phalacrocorax carbo TaxID=9209 RepID=UPI00311A27FE
MCLPGAASGPADIRLVNGSDSCVGQLEVFYSGGWCAMTSGASTEPAWSASIWAAGQHCQPSAGLCGREADPIWLDNTCCTGTEAALSKCQAWPWGAHSYGHGEDSSIVCSEPALVWLMNGSGCGSRLCYHQTSASSAAAPIAGLIHPSSLDAGLQGYSGPEEESNAKQGF